MYKQNVKANIFSKLNKLIRIVIPIIDKYHDRQEEIKPELTLFFSSSNLLNINSSK